MITINGSFVSIVHNVIMKFFFLTYKYVIPETQKTVSQLCNFDAVAQII